VAQEGEGVATTTSSVTAGGRASPSGSWPGRDSAAIAQAAAAGAEQIAVGRLRVRQVAAEDLVLLDGDEPFDVVFAVRVGALDGRHPHLCQPVLRRLAAASTPHARLYVGGDPLRTIPIPRS
jgi:hypothetical protein